MDAPARLDRIELHALELARSLLAGTVASAFRGSGMEPDGLRPYVAGDDVRALDWRVTARTGRPHVRERRDERDLELRLVVDRSASLHDAADPRPGHMALEVAGALAAAAFRAARSASLGHFSGTVEITVPPGSGRKHLRRVLEAPPRESAPGGGTDLAGALARVEADLTTRSTVAVISDFRVAPAARARVAAALARMARRHELVAVRVGVRGPEALPHVGWVAWVDPESGARRAVDTADPVARGRLLAEAGEAEVWWSSVVASLGLTPLDLNPGQPLVSQLAAGLAARRRRGR